MNFDVVLYVLCGLILYISFAVMVAVMFRRRVAESTHWDPDDTDIFILMCVVWPIGVFILFLSTKGPWLIPRVKNWLSEAKVK